MRSRLLAGVPALLLMSALTACSDDGESRAQDDATSSGGTASAATCDYPTDGTGTGVEPPPASPEYDGEVSATIKTSVGDLPVVLDATRAPCTVHSFLHLADEGFYDDTTCHRMTVSAGFEVLQCGDPTGTGSGGPGYSIPAEFDGTETYTAGTLAMARAADPNSGGSQFFIVYGDTQLQPEYTVFGQIDPAALAPIEEVAEDGVTPQMGPEDGAPITPVEITGVETR